MEKKSSAGKTVWFEKSVVEMVENYRRKQKKIPSFSETVNTLLKKSFDETQVTQKGNNDEKTEKLLKG